MTNKPTTKRNILDVYCTPKSVALGMGKVVNFDFQINPDADDTAAGQYHFGMGLPSSGKHNWARVLQTWQRYKIVKAELIVSATPCDAECIVLFVTGLKERPLNLSSATTDDLAAMPGTEFKFVSATNPEIRKVIKYPVCEQAISSTSQGTSVAAGAKNQYVQCNVQGASVRHYGYLLGNGSTSQDVNLSCVVKLTLCLDRPVYSDLAVSIPTGLNDEDKRVLENTKEQLTKQTTRASMMWEELKKTKSEEELKQFSLDMHAESLVYDMEHDQ